VSVQVNTYVVLGVQMPYIKDRYDEFEPYMDSAFKGIHHHNGLCILSDGMNGAYTILGRVLAKTENWQPFGEGVVDIRALMPPADEISAIEREIARLLKDGEDRQARIILVSHYR
jgi:hypothetical protein